MVACELSESGDDVDLSNEAGVSAAGLDDTSGPVGDEGDAVASFVDGAFPFTEAATAIMFCFFEA